MIINELYQGGGLGNQIWCYVVTRCIALKNSYTFGIQGREQYKGKDIIDLDFGNHVEPQDIQFHYTEKLIRNKYGIDISYLDPDLLNVKNGTKIYGGMQSVYYVENYKDQITEWLKIKEDKINLYYNDDDFCILHLRGGDYIGSPANSLLPLSYYQNAMNHMLDINKNMKFFMVSDDYNLAKIYCNKLNVEFIGSTSRKDLDPYMATHHHGGSAATDYAILNGAKNIIMSNSTFAWWGAYTNKNLENIICPLYWFTYNHPDNFWSTGDMRVKDWKYINRNGEFDYVN